MKQWKHVVVTIGALATVSLEASAAEPARKRIDVVERAGNEAISVHAGSGEDNVGDVLTFANDVFDAADKVKIGSNHGYCVRILVGKLWDCQVTLVLANGLITGSGPYLDTADSMLAVTGGAGAYSGARGEIRLHTRDAQGSAYEWSYRLK
jgi:hypothetical protein